MDFKLNDINKYKRFVINMRFQHNSDVVINDKADPDIKEINDKKLIEIIYPISYNDDSEYEFSDIDEELSDESSISED